MRKSSDVPLTLLAALALFVTGCHDTPESRNCVDAQGRIAPDGNCQTHSSGGGYGYHYIYGGRSGGHVGDAVVGGSTTSSGVARGGFGHAAGGEGGGE